MASSSSSDVLIETLNNRGWCFRDNDYIKTLIKTNDFTAAESELCNIDLRAIGAKYLPDLSTRSKSSHFSGPKVLQVVSVRDISKSSIAAENAGGLSGKRLLRLKLTDGHSDITAVEFTHIPSIPDNVVPGTKIRLDNKVVMRNGILCLNAKVITVLGGIVPSLYEEWEMNQKYAGFARSTLKMMSQSDDTGGPPPFEKLQAGAPLRRVNQQSKSSDNSKATLKASGPTIIEKGKVSAATQGSVNPGSVTDMNKEKQPASEARPKEDTVPIQNQAAAQKLLQKMSNYNRNEGGHTRGWKQRGRGYKDDDDSAVLTLEEWERKRAGGTSSVQHETLKVNEDEDLARQLQRQFDLEDFQEQRGPRVTEADDIRMNMFSFERDDSGAHGRGEFRGRGRGRGRRRGRGRVRGG
ncbi:uncharacterized protein [Rutidosis leptorrhynchoides]|uniref:uncharacterized protein isoform X2 n=1 Tax=Rutidosis leptorrhynchoides TaxID=125765 RepID=UPI003A99675B